MVGGGSHFSWLNNVSLSTKVEDFQDAPETLEQDHFWKHLPCPTSFGIEYEER